VLETAETLMGGPPDLFHCNDWHTALLPVYLETRYRDIYPRSRSVLTIHNLAHQGMVDKAAMPALGLDWSLFTADRLEHWDTLNLLKGGIAFADAVTTVSPSYAQEILTSEQGFQLEGFLRAHVSNLRGILNGTDSDVWNPETDVHLPAQYGADNLVGKRRCRETLLAECGFQGAAERPVLAVVARLVWQKGLDLLADLAPVLVRWNTRLIVLSSGDPVLEERFQSLAERYPDHIGYKQGFDESLSHRIHAGADMFLMPSRFEPGGLNQKYAMSDGTVPIVHGVGGLKDTVVDCGDNAADATGFVFHTANVEPFGFAVKRALHVFRHDRAMWRRLVLNGMQTDFGWRRSAQTYLDLYRELNSGSEYSNGAV
jgi:starch synthase